MSWQTKTANLEPFYAGLQLEYYYRNNDISSYIISETGQQIGYCEFSIFPDALRLYYLKIIPDLIGQGIGTAIMHYLYTYAANTGKSNLIFNTYNYAFIHLAQSKLPDKTLYIRNSFSTKWHSLAKHNILKHNPIITANFNLNSQRHSLKFVRNIFGQWNSRAPYSLHIEPSSRIWISPIDHPDEQLHGVQFLIPRSYQLMIPVHSG